MCRFEFSVYVGGLGGRGSPVRGAAARRARRRPPARCWCMVDPAARIAGGRHRRRGAPGARRQRGRGSRRSPCRAPSRPATWSAGSPRACHSSPSTRARPRCATPTEHPPARRAAQPAPGQAGASAACAASARTMSARPSRDVALAPPGWRRWSRQPGVDPVERRLAGQRAREHVLQHRGRDLGALAPPRWCRPPSRYFSRYGASSSSCPEPSNDVGDAALGLVGHVVADHRVVPRLCLGLGGRASPRARRRPAPARRWCCRAELLGDPRPRRPGRRGRAT